MADRVERLRKALGSRYTIEREIGHGGMAAVFLARDLRHDRPVAIKVLHPELASAVGGERFLQEIKLAAQLQHPHILPLYESGETETSLYYVMPFVEGESLRARLAREKQLSVNAALRCAREIALALDYAHSRGVVHRDIKPENILFAGEHAIVADFGIARALHHAMPGGQRITGTGLSVGTPAYMSPEQASGEHEVDGRSDIYSLGCVLYEMLAGVPPFTGATAQAVISKRFTTAPQSLRAHRATVSKEVESLVMRTLAPVPADRYATARELVQALERASTGEAPSLPRRRHFRRRWLIASGIGLAAAAIIVVARGALSRGAELDPSTYAILPFEHTERLPAATLNGDNCARLLFDAFSRWQGITLVNDMRVHDEGVGRNDPNIEVKDALSVARLFGAGRVIVGAVSPTGNAIRVRATLYDARGEGKVLHSYAVTIAANESDAEAKFAELADSLLVGSTGEPTLREGASATRVYPALLAYVSGYSALLDWDLASAEEQFKRATSIDKRYAAAHLWLTQVMSWRYDDQPSEWSGIAARAAALRSQLGPREAILAEALLAQGEGRFPDACERYRDLIARDSLDFVAWYGLGECHAKDRVVLRDPSSPSGWRFRSSYRSAIDAYRRALQIMPSFHLALRSLGFERLPRILFTQPNYFRGGLADTVPFGAFPSIDQDTLAFVPWPRGDLFAGRPGTRPVTVAEANRRHQELLGEVTGSWIRAFPRSSRAFEANALTLEKTGAIAGPDTASSALASIRRARALTSERDHQLRMTVIESRLLVKLDSFTAARRLADSLLATWSDPTPEQADLLAGLAALTGRIHRTAQLLAKWAPLYSPWRENGAAFSPPPPIQLRASALALYAYASFGVPIDSLRTLEQRVGRLAESWAAPRERSALRQSLIGQPARLMFQQVGLTSAHREDAGGNYLLGMQWHLARGDTSRVRADFRELQDYRRFDRPGDLKMEFTHQEALIYLGIRDTAAAIGRLDPSLNALPALDQSLLDVATAAALVRAMALRAQLAAKLGDHATAARWSEAVQTLWSGADPELQPVIDSMRTLARPRQGSGGR